MTKYNVNFYYTVVVEANDEDEAEEKGVDEFIADPPTVRDFGTNVEEQEEGL